MNKYRSSVLKTSLPHYLEFSKFKTVKIKNWKIIFLSLKGSGCIGSVCIPADWSNPDVQFEGNRSNSFRVSDN